ncbi:pentatricopeptide repeat-containing protein [Cinnamomum micranthum f. kanehirae]|uniref:Pentatricopeptide repeat-containing protein n=1 Tax=Cinnamomum micranthum f. kanehirae TaxID=337451 RepID=A0A3S3MBG9_9MAGN|nr:pentatricopeptide repeat-containing protein [Cinnamomum micranthum f. kanehirae]
MRFFIRKFSKLGYSSAALSSSNSSRIRAFVQQGLYHEALQLFSSSRRRLNCSDDKFAFPSLLKASAALSHLNHGKTIHAFIIHLDLFPIPSSSPPSSTPIPNAAPSTTPSKCLIKCLTETSH